MSHVIAFYSKLFFSKQFLKKSDSSVNEPFFLKYIFYNSVLFDHPPPFRLIKMLADSEGGG